jgi:predicted DNA-binding transcriptional regulator YafY
MKGDKYDRMARLLSVIYILNQSPRGITPEKIAEQCKVDVRTTYRDLRALQEQVKVPLWRKEGRWGIVAGHFLPPVSFTFPEAMTVFLASRLLLDYSNAYNPSIASTLMKLNSIVPGPLRDQIRSTIELMAKRKKKNAIFVHTLETLARAWMEGRRAKIRYLTSGEKSPKERIIEPYFIQPAALEHANYVIAYCHQAKSLRTFKIERIKGIQLLDEGYAVPADFDANEYLGSAWGITVDGKVETIKLRFNPEIARIAEETTWHPSQVTQRQPDGSAIVTMKLPVTVQLEAFTLGWGEKVEVLESEELRKRVARTAQAILAIYRSSSPKS